MVTLMDRKINLAMVVLLVSFLGCPVRSLSPIFNENDLVFDPTLLGIWKNTEQDEVLIFQRLGEKRYYVQRYENEGDSSAYNVQLGRIGGYWFIDSYAIQIDDDYHMLSTHLIWRIWFNDDTLRISSLEMDWLEEMIENDDIVIPYTQQYGDIILTASPTELQEFVIRYAEDSGAFPKWGEYIRVE
jgi:hypothetical protein